MVRKKPAVAETNYGRVPLAGRSQAVDEIISAPYQGWTDYFERAPRAGEDLGAAIDEMRRNPLVLEKRELPFD